jgi:hypothetical protein
MGDEPRSQEYEVKDGMLRIQLPTSKGVRALKVR